MKLLPLALLATLGALSGVASAAPTIWSANDHAYELVTNPSTQGTYAAAKAAAEARSFRGVQGRLLVLDNATYASELAFVSGVVRASSPTTSYWVGATRAAGGTDARANWIWDDGTAVPTSITNTWNIDQNEGSVTTTNYAGGFYSQDNYTTIWDYAQSAPLNFTGGYVVEYAAPVPEPATLAALGLGAAALLRRHRKG